MCEKGVVTFLFVVLVIGAIGGFAQEVQTPSEALPFLTIQLGPSASLHALAELNDEIDYFNHDARVVAQQLDDLYAITMAVSGKVPSLSMSVGASGQFFYKLLPSINAGLRIEYLHVAGHGITDIGTPDFGVRFTLDMNFPTTGGVVLIAFTPSDLLQMGDWTIWLQGGVGYYFMAASVKKEIELTGISSFTLRDEISVDVSEASWGSLYAIGCSYEAAPGMALYGCVTSRTLRFPNVGVDFNNLADEIDLDLGGFSLEGGIQLAF